MTIDPVSAPDRFSRRRAIQSTSAGAVLAAIPASLGLTHTASAQNATPEATPSTSTVPEVTAERVASAIAQLPGIAQDTMDQTGVPGLAIAVVYDDEVRYLEGFGVREVGVEGDVDADTVFQLASVSKCLASTVVASLVGEGTINWDTRIADIDPSISLGDPWITAHVTLADLFSHRSGLADHAGDTLEDLGGTREEILYGLRYLKPAGEFRASYAYTNFGLTAAAVAAATAAGSVWEDLIVDKLYEPAGMTRTTSRHDEFLAQDNRAVGHIREGDAWAHVFDRQPDAQSPAGGVSSSVRDLSQWLRLQLNNGLLDGNQLVTDAALGETHAPHNVSHPAQDPSTQVTGFYGLGWDVSYDEFRNVQLGHSGAFSQGAATTVYMLPAFGLGIIVLTNTAPIGVPETVALSFLDICRTGAVTHDWPEVLKPIFGQLSTPLYGNAVVNSPATVLPASDPATYLGTYGNDFYGDLEVVQQGDDLAMLLGPRQELYLLTHYSRDVFTYEPVGENATGPSAVTFTIGATGLATQVVIENLDLYGAGTFIRQADQA
jgi:CubicO group peptidase (beta-lactamase class C family)